MKGGVETEYTYGADGLRTQKQYGSTTYNYYYVDGRLVRMTWVNSYIDFLYDESGSIYSFVYDGNQYYYVKNLQGDVVQIYSIWGTKAVEYSYDAWGNCTIVYEHSSYGDLAEINPIRYRGYVYDFETGFYYLNSRYYDPHVRRFINADDANLLGANADYTSLNLYAYCGNDPVSRKDGEGEFWNFVIGAAIGGTISLVTSYVSAKITNSEFTLADGVASFATGALSGALTASGLPVGAIATINGVAAFGASIAADKFSDRDIDYGKAVTSAVCAIGSSIWGGNGIRHKNEAYAKALANSNALKKAATETAKGQARKLANQVAKNAAKVTADVYYEQSLVQLGKNLVTAPASVAITTVVDYANN